MGGIAPSICFPGPEEDAAAHLSQSLPGSRRSCRASLFGLGLNRDKLPTLAGRKSRSVNVAATVRRSVALILGMLLLACQHPQPALPFLPSHPITEMFPRASSPPASCPGQYRSVIEDAGGEIFLGCWGHKG